MANANDTQHARGFFLSLDGPDGGGKTTQAVRLVDWLRAQGRHVVACRDPGGTELGERLRAILLERSSVPISLRTEMLLYMTSRAQLVAEVIRPALTQGHCVVSDRYVLANVVYQGHVGGLSPDEIWAVARSATGGLLPDLTLVLDVSPHVAQTRVGMPRDRMEDRIDPARVRAGFFEAAKAYPAPLVVIDGATDAGTVFNRLQSEVARALGWDPRT